MSTLTPVDSVEVLILVDYVTNNLSSVPSFVESEFAALERRRRGSWV
jgi:7,8-dihydropterin-6-yl-methyl-4-(beta-D-ribofuranosyl)aminobenzene 5'-phosphate synthase